MASATCCHLARWVLAFGSTHALPTASAASPSPAESRPSRRCIEACTHARVASSGCVQVGEVCIQGPNVTKGYKDNPKANEEAYAGRQFEGLGSSVAA